MKVFSPMLFMNHTVCSGMPPKVGRRERAQPQKRPASSTPPLTVRLKGIAPILATSIHPKIRPPRQIPSPSNGTLLSVFTGSLKPNCAAARRTSCGSPTNSIRSPASSFAPLRTGIFTPARTMDRILTPCMNLADKTFPILSPAAPLRLTTTGRT